jgi:hypothetical protein
VKLPIDVTVNGARIVDFPGDWPQDFALRGDASLRVRRREPVHRRVHPPRPDWRRRSESPALRLSPGDPHLNTAFAVLTLLNAGRDTPTIARAVD